MDDGGSEMSVQALDLEVLVVSSREADFRVAMVFDGDLSIGTAGSGNPSPNPNPNPNLNPSPDPDPDPELYPDPDPNPGYLNSAADEAGVLGADAAGLNLTEAGLLIGETGDEVRVRVRVRVRLRVRARREHPTPTPNPNPKPNTLIP